MGRETGRQDEKERMVGVGRGTIRRAEKTKGGKDEFLAETQLVRTEGTSEKNRARETRREENGKGRKEKRGTTKEDGGRRRRKKRCRRKLLEE